VPPGYTPALVDPVTVSVVIDRPRTEVFTYLCDVANHAEFTDHFTADFRLTREDSYGMGAGARYRVKRRLDRFAWADMTFVVVESPWRLVAAGRMGKYNRVRTLSVFELEPSSGETTRVEWIFSTEPKTLSDRILEAAGGRRFFKRRHTRALKRLRSILEEGLDRGRRVTVAGGARKPSSDFHFTSPSNRSL
jgi:uncharacterized protein YndB with AHSA1/START domain